MRSIKLSLLLLLFSPSIFADVTLPRLISDGMVLQRDGNNLIWGWATNGEKVAVKLDGKLIGSTTTQGKQWSLKLTAQTAGGPHKIEIRGNNQLTVNDVYFGDVWIASGQSNMQLSMKRVKVKYPEELEHANFPQIRHFVVPGKYNFKQPDDDVEGGQWLAVNHDTIKDFSAVAYFFAKNIHQKYQVPIGIINSSYGGSPVEAWMSETALAEYPHYLEVINKYRQGSYLQDLIDSDKKRNDDWYRKLDANDLGLQDKTKWYDVNYDSSAWKNIELPTFWQDAGVSLKNGVIWFKKEFELSESEANLPARLSLGRIVDADTAYVNGIKVGNITYQYPPRRYTVEKNILKAGKNTITVRVISNTGKGGFVKDKPYFIKVEQHTIDLKGAWKYREGTQLPPLAGSEFQQYKQPLGFYNAMLAPLLKTTFKGVIWYQGESNTDRAAEYANSFPAMIRDWRKQFKQGDFPFIFVQLANFLEEKDRPVESGLAATREAQRGALNEPNTAMAVAIDVGEWNDIHPLNKKTVGDRLAFAAQKLAYGDNSVVYSGPLFNSMKINGQKATLNFDHLGSGLTYKGDKLRGFAVAGKDGKYVWAKAKITNNKVIVWSDKINAIEHVRYAWADNPAKANLKNKEGLPASPFHANK